MILDLTLIGLAITLEPVPIVAFILILSGQLGVRKGLIFILAWLAILVAVLAAVLLLTGGKPPKTHSTPSTAALAVKVALGVGLILYGVHRRRRHHPRTLPRWFAGLDSAAWWIAAGLAVILQPWALVAAGAATVVEAKLPHVTSYLALMYFCLLSTGSLLTIELYATFAPESAAARLGRLRTWMSGHLDQIVVIVSLLIGFWLVGKGIYQLA